MIAKCYFAFNLKYCVLYFTKKKKKKAAWNSYSYSSLASSDPKFIKWRQINVAVNKNSR